MELDKQFKCLECDAKFTTLEYFQNHNRRHEMSLNLPKSNFAGVSSLSTPLNKGSLSAGVIGFPDETPTPTRFIRNCEEVGLFQDLQNVNPFDEDFKKAAGNTSATPSAEAAGFEFTFSSSVVPVTPNVEHILSARNSRSKRRYSEQDTLNTPQVFPFFSSTASCHTLTTNTASMSACLTPTPQGSIRNESDTTEGLHSAPQSDFTNNVSTTSYNHEEHVSIIAYTSAISQQANNNSKCDVTQVVTKTKEIDSSITASAEFKSKKTSSSAINQQGKVSSLKIRSKTNLKLNLKHVSINKDKSSTEKIAISDIAHNVDVEEQRNKSPIDILLSTSDLGSKKEILARNRAAAHRSRERRKQWIYGLESRCRALETLLGQSQAEVARLKTENENLKMQLKTPSKKIIAIAAQNISVESISSDAILIHQASQTEEHHHHHHAIQEPLADNMDASSGLVIVSPIILPTVKAKRGRPRKGEERRVPIFAVPIISSSEEAKPLPKIPILPISHPIRKS